MAEMKPSTPAPPAEGPSAEELQRELELVRAAQPSAAGAPEPSVGRLLGRGAGRVFLLWLALIVVFLAIWQFLVPAR